MYSLEAVIALVVGIVVCFFAPFLVWLMVVSGITQITREYVRKSRQIEKPQEGKIFL
ncbi:MAG: hypothetical protein JW900_08480 [Anaerolineae bacterium]|nr:hypothetical protein [Anaerolineae bacterium]